MADYDDRPDKGIPRIGRPGQAVETRLALVEQSMQHLSDEIHGLRRAIESHTAGAVTRAEFNSLREELEKVDRAKVSKSDYLPVRMFVFALIAFLLLALGGFILEKLGIGAP